MATPDEVEMSPAELAKVLRNVADRLDAVLDVSEGPGADTDRRAAARPAASAPGPAAHLGDGRGSEAEKPEGSENIDTLVLRLWQDRAVAGSDALSEVDAVGGRAREGTDAVRDAVATASAAGAAPVDVGPHDVAAPEPKVPDGEVRGATASEATASGATAHASTSNVDAQLESVRRRMKERRAVVAVEDEPKRTWGPWRVWTEPQAASDVVRRLLVVAAIVAVSAAASLAVF